VSSSLFISLALTSLSITDGVELASELLDDTLQILDRWQILSKGCRQLPRHSVGRNSNRFCHISQRILNNRSVSALAEQKPESGAVLRSPNQVVGSRDIEIEVAGIFRLKLSRLQFDDELRVQTKMIKEQINVEDVVTDRERDLASCESEAPTKLD
jgi:hypothetical protein